MPRDSRPIPPQTSSLRRLQWWAGGTLPGASARRSQTERHAQEWGAASAAASAGRGPLCIVLGDSTAQALGATSSYSGYVAGVRDWLSARDELTWRVLNLSRSRARVADVLQEQVPLLGETNGAALVSCVVGANDLLRRVSHLEAKFDLLSAACRQSPCSPTFPMGSASGERHDSTNISPIARRHHSRLVDLWAVTGPPWRGRYSEDQFHPNDVGYSAWTEAFERTLQEKPRHSR